MKCLCVIFVIYLVVFASADSKVPKDSEPHKNEEKANSIPSIAPLKAPKKPPQKPHAPFKPDTSNLRISGEPPEINPPVLHREPPTPAKVKFTTVQPSETSTKTKESLTTNKPSILPTKTSPITNLLVPSPSPFSTRVEPLLSSTRPVLSLFGSLPELSSPSPKIREPPTMAKVKFTTVPPTEASTKTTEPLITNEPSSLQTKTPPTTNVLVPSSFSTTVKPLLTSTDLPYWKPKSTPPPKNFSSGHQILLPKLSQAKQNTSKLSVQPYNPCAPFRRPPVPDFSAPGRRISEIKCFDYIWDLKVRNDEAEQQTECESFRSRGGLSDKIVGGHYTFSGDYPNMGAIGWKAVIGTWKFMCGCTLISHNFVLTAAHCSSAPSDTTIADVIPKIVRLGDKNIQDVVDGTNDDVNIIRIITHPKYKSPKQYFDIALMELEKKLKFSEHIQPACLWTKDTITRYVDEAQVTGWGVVESGTLKTSPELLAATVDIIDFQKCNRLLHMSCNRNWCGLQPDQLCAGKLGGGVDACQGDSGGPLQVKIPLPIGSQGTMHYVLGVTSFGVGCALPGLPGVYTKVASFLDWIEEIVWPAQNETAPEISDKPTPEKNDVKKRSVRSVPEGPLLGWPNQIRQSNI